MNRSIAFFDFDGTITTHDTLAEIIKYQKGPARYYIGLLLLSPILVAWKLKLMKNSRAKEKLLQFFFGGTPIGDFQADCDRFVREKLPSLIRPGAMAEIERLRGLGIRTYLVSASASNWIQGWADEHRLTLLSTQMEVVDGKITGRFVGENCHGEEKVRRIRAVEDLGHYQEIFCYGDSSGDKQMLALGTISYYRPFR